MKDQTIKLPVQGMTCMHCAGTVKKAVESVRGTSNVNVSLDEHLVAFDMEDDVDIRKVRDAIRHAGYEA